MAGRVAGKVAFITGAARGQGRSHAIRLAEEGADIIAVDVCGDIPNVPYSGATPADLADTVAAVEALDRQVVSTQADVRDLGALREAVERGMDRFGRIDIVCANAGISSSPYLSHDLPEEVWRDLLDINLTGAWHTAKAAIPHLIAGARGGSIILTGSGAGLKAYPHVAHYVSAKHGLVGLTRAMALELGQHNIRVNSVHPTQVDTDMLVNESTMRLFCPGIESPTKDDLAAVSQQMHVLPAPWVESIDISNAVLFLASDEGRFITGVALPVDCGAIIK